MVPRVLVIDGDDETRERYAEFLRSVGFKVFAESDAHGVVTIAVTSRIDVVVTDANPRGAIDGIEVARRLRADKQTRHVRVVMLIADGDADGRAKARAAGANAVLLRRSSAAALTSEIRRVVANSFSKGSS